jgi:hypothetical protein
VLKSCESKNFIFQKNFQFDFNSDDPLIIFSGGLPRSSYSNKHSVSCLCENEHNTERTRHVTFDFTAAVIDFFTIDKLSNDGFMLI